MKTVYFVRHGQSEGNVGIIQQVISTELTEKGREQARRVGKRIADLPIEVILSSTMVRARQTAAIINEHKNVALEHTDMVVERRRPTVQHGIARYHPQWLLAEKSILLGFKKAGFRHSDEENFEDLKQRAAETLRYLESRSEDHILVVTHGFFMRVLYAYIVFGESLTGRECERFIRTFYMRNTGLTIASYEEGKWRIDTWNDTAHL